MMPYGSSSLEGRVNSLDRYVSTGRPVYAGSGGGVYPVDILKYPVVIEDPTAPNRPNQRYISNREMANKRWDTLVGTIEKMHGEYATYLNTFAKYTRPYIAAKVGPLNGRHIRYYGAMISKDGKIGAALLPLRKVDRNGNVQSDFKHAVLFKDSFGLARSARDLAVKMGIPDAYGIMFFYFHEDVHLHGEMSEERVFTVQAEFYKAMAAKTSNSYYKAIYTKLSLVARAMAQNVDQIYGDLMGGNAKAAAELIASELGISFNDAMSVMQQYAAATPAKPSPKKTAKKANPEKSQDGHASASASPSGKGKSKGGKPSKSSKASKSSAKK